MAVNESRSMTAELQQGIIDGTYMQMAPNWSTEANPPTERMDWPTYGQVERHTHSNVQQVPHVTNEIISQARDRAAMDLASHPRGGDRPTQVNATIYNSGIPRTPNPFPPGSWRP